MIVCSCNVLTEARILATGETLAREAPGRIVTPARVFRALGVKPQCMVCFSEVRGILARAGLTVTCPEPLASVAEEGEDLGALSGRSAV
jgi:bacterioferritin-associated ferredoxin